MLLSICMCVSRNDPQQREVSLLHGERPRWQLSKNIEIIFHSHHGTLQMRSKEKNKNFQKFYFTALSQRTAQM
jgi:long-subunit fatty acid transport protein